MYELSGVSGGHVEIGLCTTHEKGCNIYVRDHDIWGIND